MNRLQRRTFLSFSDQRWVCTLLHILPETFRFNRDIYVFASLCVGVIASVWWGNAALPRAPTRSLARRKVLRYLSFSIKAQELLLAPWKRCLSDIILHFLVARWGPVFHSDVVRRISSWNIATKSRITWLKLAGMSSSPSVTDTEPEPDFGEQGHRTPVCLHPHSTIMFYVGAWCIIHVLEGEVGLLRYTCWGL